MCRNKKGFSLLELLIVISIVAVLGTVGVGFYLNYAKNVEIKTVANTLISDLKQAQAKSMAGTGGLKWGVHLVNGDADYYESFSSPSDYSDAAKNIISTNYLSSGVSFSDPTSGSTKDIIFNKITGGTTEASITLSSSEVAKTIGISSIGTIEVQSVPSGETPVTVAIGDIYQGGIVAYILQEGENNGVYSYDANVQHGLIAAASDQSEGIQWYNGSNFQTGANSSLFGLGVSNTNTAVSAQGLGSYATQLCYDLTLGNYSDWFLPSINELSKIYLSNIIIGGFTDTWYWSSSEHYIDTAERESFSNRGDVWDGKVLDATKNELMRVRCVRSF